VYVDHSAVRHVAPGGLPDVTGRVERWIRAGEPELPCLVDGYQSTHHYGDDRRQPVR
jgi:hypothetical protein